MNKLYIKSIIFGLATLALTGCSEPADEITSIEYSRNFSPTSFEAKVRNRTNVELTWTLGEGVTEYNLEVYENDNLTFTGTPVRTYTVKNLNDIALNCGYNTKLKGISRDPIFFQNADIEILDLSLGLSEISPRKYLKQCNTKTSLYARRGREENKRRL